MPTIYENNPYIMARLRQAFPSPQLEVPAASVPAQPPGGVQTTRPDPSKEYFDAIQRARANRPMTDKYSGLLENHPDERDYAPSVWRAIGAGVVGAGSFLNKEGMERASQATQDFGRAPYRRAMERYRYQLENTGKAAHLEQADIEAQTNALKDAAALGMDYRKYLETVRNNLEDQRLQEMNINMPEYMPPVVDLSGGLLFQNRKKKGDYFQVQGGNPVEAVRAANDVRRVDIEQQRADTDKYQADTQRQRSEWEEQLGNARHALDMDQFRHVPVADVRQATDQVMEEMFGDPDFRPFVKYNEQTGEYFLADRDNYNTEEWNLFRQAFNRRVDFLTRRSTEVDRTAEEDRRRVRDWSESMMESWRNNLGRNSSGGQ